MITGAAPCFVDHRLDHCLLPYRSVSSLFVKGRTGWGAVPSCAAVRNCAAIIVMLLWVLQCPIDESAADDESAAAVGASLSMEL
jgi:hypothetical protein